MAEKRRIRYVPVAVDDLDALFNFISEDNRSAATKMADRIENAILKLATNPRLGAVLPSDEPARNASVFRYIVVKPYVIFYRIDNDDVIVARILHSRQDWMHLLFTDNFQ
jgi:toxin ParE1/3/4